MSDIKCILCGGELDDNFCCICGKCGDIELVDKLPEGDGPVEDEKYMTD